MRNIMRHWVWLCIGIIGLFGGGVYAQKTVLKEDKQAVDGPYVLYDETGKMRVIGVDEQGILRDSVYAEIPDDFVLDVVAQKGGHRFQVKLHPVIRPEWKAQQRKETVIISDPHGDMDCFVSVLQNNGVIGKHYEWIFGKNQLIIIGDVFDRGKDVLPIFWLIYKLEQEAKNAGGIVTFMLGNHEEMILRNNLKYVRSKYKDLAGKLGMEYSDLWHDRSELGRWLSSRNLIQVIGSDLFVHAGLSPEFTRMDTPVAVVNETVGKSIFFDKTGRKELSALADSIYGNFGPFWYRGMVLDDAKYRPLSSGQVNDILAQYGVKRIFVGHTIFDDVTSFFDGKVIAVNVNNQKNREAGKGRGILIKGNKLYVVYDKGKPKIFR